MSSAEDALKILAEKRRREEAAAKAAAEASAPKPQMSTKEDELAAYKYVQGQLNLVRNLRRKFGEPNPVQCGRFLKRLTAGLIKHLRFPRPDVRNPVSTLFKECSWEIRQNRSVRNSKPPSGDQLEDLAFALVCFFAKRFGEKCPTRLSAPRAPKRGGSRRRNPAPRKYNERTAAPRGNRRRGSDSKGEDAGDGSMGNRSRPSNGRRRGPDQKVTSRRPAATTTRSSGKHGGQGRNRRRGGVAGTRGRDSGGH